MVLSSFLVMASSGKRVAFISMRPTFSRISGIPATHSPQRNACTKTGTVEFFRGRSWPVVHVDSTAELRFFGGNCATNGTQTQDDEVRRKNFGPADLHACGR